MYDLFIFKLLIYYGHLSVFPFIKLNILLLSFCSRLYSDFGKISKAFGHVTATIMEQPIPVKEVKILETAEDIQDRRNQVS